MSDLRETVEANHLVHAKSSIEANGRYWFFDSRLSANKLVSILEGSGYNVVLHELEPDWEHVVSLVSNSIEETVEMAKDRAADRAKGVPEAKLPK